MNTFQALAVTMLAVLPGASYTFAYERVVVRSGSASPTGLSGSLPHPQYSMRC